MERRGHEILWPDGGGNVPEAELLRCDVVLVHRRSGTLIRDLITRLKRRGVGIVWDDDDDFRNLPKSRSNRRDTGLSNPQIFRNMVRCAGMADVFTVTTPALAAAFRRAGAPLARVMEYHLVPEPRPARWSDGITVGWIAGLEHRSESASSSPWTSATSTPSRSRSTSSRTSCRGSTSASRRSSTPRSTAPAPPSS
ncbi:MAG TPA: hypothetical protein VI318_11295 [Baekduia sp.]